MIIVTVTLPDPRDDGRVAVKAFAFPDAEQARAFADRILNDPGLPGIEDWMVQLHTGLDEPASTEAQIDRFYEWINEFTVPTRGREKR